MRLDYGMFGEAFRDFMWLAYAVFWAVVWTLTGIVVCALLWWFR